MIVAQFRKAQLLDQNIIFEWLDKPHVKMFWDNSEAHRNDIVLFINGRKEVSSYFYGLFTYWIGCDCTTPFCFLMTSDLSQLPNQSEKQHLSKTGKTVSIDFMIGDEDYVGKGLAAHTLKQFMEFMRKTDALIDTFIIDPDIENTKAQHVYEQAGFEVVSTYTVGQGYFSGKDNFLMKKTF